MSAVLAVENLWKRYGGIAALAGCTFAIERPGIYGLIGPNGAGKTTLFDAVTGFATPEQGSIRIEGREVRGIPPHRLVRRRVARTFQDCRVFAEKTCLENLLFSVQRKDLAWTLSQAVTRTQAARSAADAEALRLLELVGLRRHAEEPASALSFGERRLLEIVGAFMTRPRILLLDEPASGVNPSLLETLAAFILRMYEESPMVFLIVEHNMEFIMRLAGNIIVMHQGAVLERGTPQEIRASPRVIEAYLG